MNIFATSECPVESAYNLPNVLVNKMILESAQMLSTTHTLVDGVVEISGKPLYKKTHQNHPSSVWCRASKENYMWLYEHFKALTELFEASSGKVHLTAEKLLDVLSEPPVAIPDTSFVYSGLPTPAMPDVFKELRESVDVKYQQYLNWKFKDWLDNENKACKGLVWYVDYPYWLSEDVVKAVIGGL